MTKRSEAIAAGFVGLIGAVERGSGTPVVILPSRECGGADFADPVARVATAG